MYSTCTAQSSMYSSKPTVAFNPQCDKEIEQVQSQLDDYKDPPLSLSRLSLKQQKFRTFREMANVSGITSTVIYYVFCVFVDIKITPSMNAIRHVFLTPCCSF